MKKLPNRLVMRRADSRDHDFLVRVDLKNDGYSAAVELKWDERQQAEHREKIRKFLMDQDKGAFVMEDSESDKPVGMIMYSIANRDHTYPWATVYEELDRNWFQSDGRFMEIFQLWVHPDYRRMGLATKLKLRLEEEAVHRQVNLIYTHTEEANHHVIELNLKLGYEEVRRGAIWDEILRVSLIKRMNSSK